MSPDWQLCHKETPGHEVCEACLHNRRLVEHLHLGMDHYRTLCRRWQRAYGVLAAITVVNLVIIVVLL